ncbi:MAG: type II toxin-antitoxin system HicB family antitoxin [Deltaproteobacteria bacterium]|nr:type II toxin-antitoxin system HicB family antitoxin [Deltaproteobacteria bacterium]
MVFKGFLWKEKKNWLIEIPSLDLTTQGKTKQDAFFMLQDAIKCLLANPHFKTKITLLKSESRKIVEFVLQSNNDKSLIGLFLKQQRQKQHLTVREVAHRLGYQSASAYAQYETGKHSPGIDKITKFLSAINPKAWISLEVI